MVKSLRMVTWRHLIPTQIVVRINQNAFFVQYDFRHGWGNFQVIVENSCELISTIFRLMARHQRRVQECFSFLIPVFLFNSLCHLRDIFLNLSDIGLTMHVHRPEIL
ncbi:hypothetical protein VNO77_03816 [Canavalia gladiata]|uniref:Uncharacterized protein n=1 Tax=Canavalia gladiata TaxID=3824 RepID=A0AAN9MXF5_CANGL